MHRPLSPRAAVYVALSLGGSGAVQAQTAVLPAAYYIAPNGLDSNTGGVNDPFASFAMAQLAMQGSSIKTTYLRAGMYANASLTLVAADSGETWSYYPPDGVDSAVLDGGASAPATGGNLITIIGASNVTINGLTLQNFREWGIGIHGGAYDARAGYPYNVGTADRVTVVNNVFNNGYTTANSGWAGGALWADGQVTNLTIDHNVASNQYGSCYRVGADGDGGQPYDNISNLTISNNACLNSNIGTGDNGAIYVQDQTYVVAGTAQSTNLWITNNFVRDYQCNPTSGCNANDPNRDVAIYLDRGAANLNVTGNVIANTANTFPVSGSISSTTAIFMGSSQNSEIIGNLIDLGSNGWICDVVYEQYDSSDPTTGNFILGNIFIGNWIGPQTSGALGVLNRAYPGGGQAPQPAEVLFNLYYNYGGGGMSAQGNVFSDAEPVMGQDPLVSGYSYQIAGSSPVYHTAVNLIPITGGWGPPGYVLPENGTPPSSPY
jgi:hypothetical protein